MTQIRRFAIIADGGEALPVGRLAFKAREGRQTALSGFDSHSLPPILIRAVQRGPITSDLLGFFSCVVRAGVEFLACDQPFASRLTLHILAAVAEDEARRISERTKAALQAAKARGRKLGSPIAAKTVAKARAARSAYAAKAKATTLAVVREVQKSGVTPLAGIARTLEARGVKTPRGRSEWQPVQVSRLLAAA